MKNYLSSGNSKMNKMSGVRTYSWGIPAFKSKSGFKTCPYAGKCVTGCYARQGAYIWPNVSQALENRLALSRSPEFVDTIANEIAKRKVMRLRVHDSGDFYSPKYIQDWFKIMRLNPYTQFYAYTKAIPLFQGLELPANFTLVFSEGGTRDDLITPDMRHSRVFPNVETLKAAGYIDTSKDDANAIGPNNKIGLIYHGSKGKTWTTHKNSND